MAALLEKQTQNKNNLEEVGDRGLKTQPFSTELQFSFNN